MAAQVPGGCQPLDQANQPQPQIRLKLAAVVTTLAITIYYYSAQKLILILPSHGG